MVEINITCLHDQKGRLLYLVDWRKDSQNSSKPQEELVLFLESVFAVSPLPWYSKVSLINCRFCPNFRLPHYEIRHATNIITLLGKSSSGYARNGRSSFTLCFSFLLVCSCRDVVVPRHLTTAWCFKLKSNYGDKNCQQESFPVASLWFSMSLHRHDV